MINYKKIPQNLIKAVEANKTRKDFLANEILKLKPKVIGIYRLVMKKGSDNFRYSSIHDLIRKFKTKKDRNSYL